MTYGVPSLRSRVRLSPGVCVVQWLVTTFFLLLAKRVLRRSNRYQIYFNPATTRKKLAKKKNIYGGKQSSDQGQLVCLNIRELHAVHTYYYDSIKI